MQYLQKKIEKLNSTYTPSTQFFKQNLKFCDFLKKKYSKILTQLNKNQIYSYGVKHSSVFLE